MGILLDGFSTTIAFADNSAVLLEEKEVTPIGVEGGGEIDVTTMRNTTVRTKAPKSLYSITDPAISAAYDPAVLDQIFAMINSNQLITITQSDGSTQVFWGWIDAFVPGAFTKGEQPMADLTIIASNRNGSGVETVPLFTAAP